jgi:hypothetical protein
MRRTVDQFQKAANVLQALIHGTDPETGEELSSDTIVNRIDVSRALLTAVEAMERVEARFLRRAQLPAAVGTTWTDEEEKQLVAEFANGDSIALIAERHLRTVRAIEARAERIGLMTAAQRMTSNSFFTPPHPPQK